MIPEISFLMMWNTAAPVSEPCSIPTTDPPHGRTRQAAPSLPTPSMLQPSALRRVEQCHKHVLGLHPRSQLLLLQAHTHQPVSPL